MFTICGLLCCSLLLFLYQDYKKIIAIWSILHTGLCIVLLFHNDLLFIGLCCFCNFTHLLSSAFMFIILGVLYDLYGRDILMAFFGFSL